MRIRFLSIILATATCFAASDATADCSPFFTAGSGAALTGDASCIPANGVSGDDLRAAQGGASGTISITGGAVVTLNRESDNPVAREAGPGFIAGRRLGGVAAATIDGAGSTLLLEADGSSSFAMVGRETTGSLTISNGGGLIVRDLTAPAGSGTVSGESLSVGMDGGFGTLLVDNGAILIDSASGAFMFVGREGGNGFATIRNGSDVAVIDRETSAGATTSGANITLGRDAGNVAGGGAGTLIVEGESSVSVTTLGVGYAGLNVGRDAGASGAMTIRDGSTVSVTGGGDAGLSVGRDAGTNGVLTITDGASVTIDSNRSFADFGRGVGSTGIVSVTDGGSLSVIGDADGDMRIGAAFTDFGRETAGFGSLLVSGVGSLVEAQDRVIVGAPEEFGGGASSGILNVADGGVLRATTVNLGTGGVLTGDGGGFDADVRVSGGVVAPGSSPGVMDILGDFTILGGTLQFEIAGADPDQFDTLNILGDFLATDPFLMELSFLDGFSPEAGQAFGILNISGDSGDLDALLAASLVTFDVAGLPRGFDFAFDLSGGTLEVRTTSVGQVPLPATAPFLILALSSLVWLRRRRASLQG